MQENATAVAAKGDSFWDLYSRVYDSVYHLIPYRGLLWQAYEALSLEPGMHVLDAGCGTGNFEHFISGKNPPAIQIDALDASDGMLSIARRKCRDLGYVRFSEGDLNGALPFADGTFDRIVTINVLYALDDPDGVVGELLRVLKPNGVLVISSPLPCYSVSPMIADHFRRLRNIWGLHRQIGTVLDTLWTLITGGAAQWLLNNFVINGREAAGAYRSLDRSELESLLDRQRSQGVRRFEVCLASADQNVFATAVKAAAA
ncbi:MAG: class I SAM-dependent methyltransferase [Coriobacteriia bacterium]|nr:class I SAM-dependent methyltransferase [Coriobacteriia bacterium]